eukprot:29051-Pelagococcus_subviridis.AAC.3
MKAVLFRIPHDQPGGALLAEQHLQKVHHRVRSLPRDRRVAHERGRDVRAAAHEVQQRERLRRVSKEPARGALLRREKSFALFSLSRRQRRPQVISRRAVRLASAVVAAVPRLLHVAHAPQAI